ncbi:hypothetical protein ACFE04_024610 [Oxalis oulophora]
MILIHCHGTMNEMYVETHYNTASDTTSGIIADQTRDKVVPNYQDGGINQIRDQIPDRVNAMMQMMTQLIQSTIGRGNLLLSPRAFLRAVFSGVLHFFRVRVPPATLPIEALQLI